MKTKEYNIIGDIAGEYNTLIALLDKMPTSATPLSVGDMIDRGNESRKVLDFFMKTENEAIIGNHEHMMLHSIRATGYYQDYTWGYNGGIETLRSFLDDPFTIIREGSTEEYYKFIDKKYLDWIASLPLYIKSECKNKDGLKAFISHAPLNQTVPFSYATDIEIPKDLRLSWSPPQNNVIWNRDKSTPMMGYYQIHGHNAYVGFKEYKEEGKAYATCIDTSHKEVLTGIHFPSMEVFSQEFLE